MHPNGCLHERCSQCEASSFKQNAPEKKEVFMTDALYEKPVLLKQNATQMDAFMKDALNVKPVLVKQNASKMDAFMKDAPNVKPVLLKQNAPKWMPL